MPSVVRFRAGDGEFAVMVDQTREVRTTEGLMALPEAAPSVVGLLTRGEEALTVVAPLGMGGNQVLVLEPSPAAESRAFGVLVHEVIGVTSVADDQVGPPPDGQAGGLVSGVIWDQGRLVMLVDADVLGRAWTP
jgi:chemotaxis signal transduction protein